MSVDRQPSSSDSLAGRRIGTYDIDRLLGKGGGGAVYRARSTEAGPAGPAGTAVALKVFHPELVTDDRIFQRFRREAELGMRIRHPHVVRTFEVGVEEIGGMPFHFLAMELAEGETLRHLLSELHGLPEHLLYQVADQVLDALEAIHAEGMIHRDIKPENIVLAPDDRHVRLMDLGVARLQQEGRDLTRAGEFVGSLAYAAPEQFMDQDHVDPRADLYAVGVLLYEMATGVNPYDETDLSALIRLKLGGQVRRPKSVNRDVDPFLDEVILTCLRSAPDERFGSCAELRGVLAEGESGAWWKQRIEGETFPAATRALRRLRPRRDAPLVGRTAELERLHEAWRSVQAGTGAVVVVRGAAGVGKSRLVHDFLEDLAAPDGPCLWAGGFPEEGTRACHAFLEAACGFFGDRAAMEERLREAAPDLASAVAAHAFGTGGGVPVEDLGVALRGLLRALAAARPLVVVVDDLQRADEDGSALFGQLARALEDVAVLLVATVRPEDVPDGSAVHALLAELPSRRDTAVIDLEPLDRDGTDALIAALVGRSGTARALGWPVFAVSGGNPQFVVESVAHLEETGELVEAEDGWTLARPLDGIELPSDLRALAARRLEALDDESREILETAAVQGAAFDAALLADVTGQKRLRLLKKLAQLERRHRLLVSSGKTSFRFAIPGLQRAVCETIPEERRRDLHARYADALRREATDRGAQAHALVGHLLEAGRLAEARGLVVDALDYAVAHQHAAEAAVFAERVANGLPADEHAARFEALMRLAALRALRGRADAEAGALADALTEAEALADPVARARVRAARGAAAWRAGRYDDAEAETTAALELADGDALCRGECLHVLGAVAYRRGDFPRAAEHWRDALATRREAGDRRGEAATLLRLGAVLPEIGEDDRALETCRTALEILRELGDARAEAAALIDLGAAHEGRQELAQALACYEEALRIGRDLGDLPVQAVALDRRARAAMLEARIDDAKEAFDQALDLYREIGDPSGEARVLGGMGAAVAQFGELETALACLERAREAAERTGETPLLVQVLRRLAAVQHEAGLRTEAWEQFDRALELARSRTRATVLADMGRAAEREGDPERATQLLEKGLASAEGQDRLVGLCRLARAHRAAGRDAQARACAGRVEEMIDAGHPVAPHHGPELYYTLGTVLADTERGRRHLETATQLVGGRTRSIRSVVYRQHYLTTLWPNREIQEEAKRLVGPE